MRETNCQNCGAPIDDHLIKCPYCETPYECDTDEVIFYADNNEIMRMKRRN